MARPVAGEPRGLSDIRQCADAEGQRTGRRYRHLPPGGASVHRQADRAGAELRRPGRHRHREHAAAQRIAPAHRDLPNRWSSRRRPRRCCRSSVQSPGELRRSLQAMLDNATRIARRSSATCCCATADVSHSWRCTTRRRHCRGPAERTDALSGAEIGPWSHVSRSRSCHIAEWEQNGSYQRARSAAVALSSLRGARTVAHRTDAQGR